MELSGKRVLVTGGAGFIGSHLVDALQGCQVRVVDNFTTGRAANLAHHEGNRAVEIVRGDIADAARLDEYLDGVDVVFHLACRGVRHSIGNPWENHEVNASGTLLLLEAARRANVARFVHVSSSEVYGTARYVPMDENHPTFPETVYGGAKLAGECYARAYCQTYNFPTVVVRPFNNFGPRSHHEGDSGEVIPRFVVWALNGQRPVIFGDGLQTRDFIYVTETARWLRRIAQCDAAIGQTLNLGSGSETTVRELAEIVYQQVGREDLPPEFLPPRPGDVRRLYANAERAKQLLDFHTETSLPEGIGHLIAHFRAAPGGPASLLGQMQSVNWAAA